MHRHLLAQSQQWKLESDVSSMLKVNNKDTRMTSLIHYSGVFEQISYIALVFLFLNLNK